MSEAERLPPIIPQVPLVAFLERLHLGGLNLVRERDRSRNVDWLFVRHSGAAISNPWDDDPAGIPLS